MATLQPYEFLGTTHGSETLSVLRAPKTLKRRHEASGPWNVTL